MYMSPEEKQISFYNRYFIFRKNRNINAKQLKNSFLTYAGLQEEQNRAGEASLEAADESSALEKIAKASRPIDVASKPAIAAHIIERQKEADMFEAITAATGSASAPVVTAAAAATTQKNKPKLKRVSTLKAPTAAAASEAASEAAIEPSAPIEQIEKKIQKRTKKASAAEQADIDNPPSAAAAAAAAAAPAEAAKPKRQTKKKTNL
ncbi:MAG: hypothetical protein EBU66_19670 [Bacteroidetes bacterium]|nr:hypothetical protein [Bacteroidota bacterium]